MPKIVTSFIGLSAPPTSTFAIASTTSKPVMILSSVRTVAAPNVTASVFTLPFPSEDVVFNPHLLEPAQEVNVRETYKYNF